MFLRNIFKKVSLITLLLSFTVLSAYAHGGWEEHARDVMTVFGFEWDARKAFNNGAIKDWIKFISSDMIDNVDFHKKLAHNHPGFQDISNANKHRILFHWGYDAKPWNAEIEEEVKTYCEQYDLNFESNLRVFKSEIRDEQRRRNREINNRTETLFGFAHGGKDASYARFFAAMTYNIHILGDYTSDNTQLRGLQELNTLIGQIITELRNFDDVQSKLITRKLTTINRTGVDNQLKADELLACLKRTVPQFLKTANNGAIYNRLVRKGFVFVNSE